MGLITRFEKKEIREKIIEIIGEKEKVTIAHILNIIRMLIDVLANDYNLPIGYILKINNLFIDCAIELVRKQKNQKL